MVALVAGCVRLVVLVAAAIASVSTAAAQGTADPANVLAGKTIRWIIASAPNSNTDNFARGLIAGMEAVLPRSTILAQNIPNSAVALAEAESATGDALVVVIAHVTSIYGQMLGTEAFPTDLTTFHWIGALTNNERIVGVRAGLGVDTIEGLAALDRTLMAPNRGAGNPGAIEAYVLAKMFGLELNMVPDVDDALTNTLFLAGDADFVVNSYRTLMPLVEAGAMTVLLRLGEDGFPPELQDVPTLAEAAPEGAPAEIMEVIESLNRLGRLVMAVPAADEASVEALRAAFDEVTASAALADFYADHNLVLAPTPAAEVGERMDFLLANPASAAALKAYLQ